jgi:ABC-type branched-subunit amino acid transport system ATPase component
MPPSPEAIEVRKIEKRFDGVRALDGVSVDINRREILGVIGPNGSGKTTLLNAITGVVRADSGEMRCGNARWRWLPPYKVLRLGIARTFQNIRLFEGMTVREHVEVAAANAGDDAARPRESADEVLEQLGLQDHADLVAQTLAYGIQRRVELARALASRPAFLLLDEPAAGLNSGETDALRRDLLEIRERAGCGIVLIDHDVRLIMRTCERVVVLNDGRTISEGTPDVVRRDPAVVAAYLG